MDRSKLLVMMMGKKKPPEEDDEEPEDEGDVHEDGLHAAMEDFLHAVKGGDSAGMAEAFKHALDVADDDEPEPDDDEDDKKGPFDHLK